MLSRVADSIYWMSRYIERAENVARFIDVNLHFILDQEVGSQEQWEPLVFITGDSQLFYELYSEANRESVIQFLTFDRRNQNSILSCLQSARENARSIREIISSEMWEQINTFYLKVSDIADNQGNIDSPHDFYTSIKMNSHLFVGITDTTLSHSEGWHFSRMGRLLERADKTSRIIDVKYFYLLPNTKYVGTSYDDMQWIAVLKSASGFEMYRKRFHRISPERVIEFLILDRDFPRAMLYSLNKANDSLQAISGSQFGYYNNKPEQSLGLLRSELAYTDIISIIASGLHEYLDAFQAKLNNLSNDIFETFFELK